MKITISDVSTITPGVSFRGSVPETAAGTLGVVQMSDVGQAAQIDSAQLAKIDFNSKYDKYLLRPGDLLFLGRGSRNTASIVGEDFPLAIPMNYFTRLRLKHNGILPEYLAIYLNLNETQRRIREMARGTVLTVIPMSELIKLEIDVPPLETQMTIVELNRQLLKANDIEGDIQKKRSLLVEAAISGFFE